MSLYFNFNCFVSEPHILLFRRKLVPTQESDGNQVAARSNGIGLISTGISDIGVN